MQWAVPLHERVPFGVIKDASWEIPIKEGLNGKNMELNGGFSKYCLIARRYVGP
jgi:hypothetical protein